VTDYKGCNKLASQTIVSWNPLALWLGAVDKLRRSGLAPMLSSSEALPKKEDLAAV
jgi:hypothetical protein